MEQKAELQELGNNLCPIIDKKADAAKILGLSESGLTAMEDAGLVLYRYLPGLKRPKYLRGDLNNFYNIYMEWCNENPEQLRELMS